VAEKEHSTKKLPNVNGEWQLVSKDGLPVQRWKSWDVPAQASGKARPRPQPLKVRTEPGSSSPLTPEAESPLEGVPPRWLTPESERQGML